MSSALYWLRVALGALSFVWLILVAVAISQSGSTAPPAAHADHTVTEVIEAAAGEVASEVEHLLEPLAVPNTSINVSIESIGVDAVLESPALSGRSRRCSRTRCRVARVRTARSRR